MRWDYLQRKLGIQATLRPSNPLFNPGRGLAVPVEEGGGGGLLLADCFGLPPLPPSDKSPTETEAEMGVLGRLEFAEDSWVESGGGGGLRRRWVDA